MPITASGANERSPIGIGASSAPRILFAARIATPSPAMRGSRQASWSRLTRPSWSCLRSTPFAHAPGDAQHERFAPLQSEQAVHLLDLRDLDQEQPELLALLPVGLDRVAEDLHEGRVLGGRQRPHHAALSLAARRQRREHGELQEVEALQGEQALGAPLRVPGVQPQRAARHRALEAQAVAPHALDRLALGVERPFPERRIDRLGAPVRGRGVRERGRERPGGRNEQVRRAIAHLREHRLRRGRASWRRRRTPPPGARPAP